MSHVVQNQRHLVEARSAFQRTVTPTIMQAVLNKSASTAEAQAKTVMRLAKASDRLQHLTRMKQLWRLSHVQGADSWSQRMLEPPAEGLRLGGQEKGIDAPFCRFWAARLGHRWLKACGAVQARCKLQHQMLLVGFRTAQFMTASYKVIQWAST